MMQTILMKLLKLVGLAGLALSTLLPSVAVYASNAAGHSHHFSNPNWQDMFHSEDWNWMHNWAYHAPQYHFETTFPVDQWGRPTTSNATAQRPQNVRRDRHAAFLPPAHGSTTGFFSGEFPTNPVNPFAPTYNNNPSASRAIAVEESVFALRPGEAGVNVRADGSHVGGFLASTSVVQGSGNQSGASGGLGSAAHSGAGADGSGNGTVAPWAMPSSQSSSSGFTVTHTPITGAGTSQSGSQSNQSNQAIQSNQPNRITTVTPFADGTIARIMIPALGNRAAMIRSGVDLATLDDYVGHFPHTSQWDGNVSLASHNRGRGSFFAGIWTLQRGDIIFYETTLGVRVYEVVSIEQIAETDLSVLDHSHENILTFITCVYNRPGLRWALRARQVG